ncbi:MAG: pilus assembly protein PilM [Pseudomonadota bacterium]
MTLAFQGDGVAAASIGRVTGSKPVVKLGTFFPGSAAPTLEALEKIGKELGAQGYRCTNLLAANEYQLLAVDAPNVPAEELKSAVRWRLKDMIDFHVDDATIDVLSIPANPAARSASMFAVAARNSLVEQRQALFSDAKLPLSVIDIAEMAQRNIAALVEPEGRGIAMLSFGHDGGLLTVTYGGELYLSRRIDVSPAQMQEPDHDRKHATFDKITLELQRSLDHFDRQFHYISVAKLLLAPAPANGLEEYLSSNLYTPVDSLDLASVLDLDAVPALAEKSEQQRFFLALGAALRLEETTL